ncbi:MAG: three-Cys-motif partner protein TcmP [Dehalococcoidia bacterium]
MAQTSHFFEQLRDHSEIKLRILGKFVVPWSAKLGFKAQARGGQRIWYVDGFAGPGKYRDGKAGSPLIGAGQALGVLRGNKEYVLGCVNVEREPSYFRSLEELTQHFKDQGVPMHNLHGDFSSLVPRIAEIIGAHDPVLVFIDPFGIKPLVYQSLKHLIARPGEVDLILIFQTRAVWRLATEHGDLVTRAVGSDEWAPLWKTQRLDAVLDTLEANLLSDGKFCAVAAYGVRAEKEAAPKYHMVMASRSVHAFELLNDMICQEEKQLGTEAYARRAQTSFLPEFDRFASQQELTNAILAHCRAQSRTTRRDIVDHILLSHWGQWHTGDVKQAVRGLIEAGWLARHKRGKGQIDTDPLTLAE